MTRQSAFGGNFRGKIASTLACTRLAFALLPVLLVVSCIFGDDYDPPDRIVAEGTVMDAVTGEPLGGATVELEAYRVTHYPYGDDYWWDSIASDESDLDTGAFRIEASGSSFYFDYRLTAHKGGLFQPEGAGSGYGFSRYSRKCESLREGLIDMHLQPHGVLRVRFEEASGLGTGERIVFETSAFNACSSATNLRGFGPPLPEHFDMEIEAGIPVSIEWIIERIKGNEPGSAVIVGQRFGMTDLTVQY